MGLYYYGLRDTTATYATNFLNITPIVTFIFSVILRVESLRLNTRAGKVKTVGAIVSVAGALTIIFYQGKSFHINHQRSRSHTKIIPSNWTRATLMLVGSCLSYGIWFIVQAKVIKVFPLKYWSTMLTCIIASGQATIVGLCIDRSRKSWSLGWNLQLITIVHSGALATAATFCLISWVIAKRGPTYPSMFYPLTLIFITVLEALILGEAIHLGMYDESSDPKFFFCLHNFHKPLRFDSKFSKLLLSMNPSSWLLLQFSENYSDPSGNI
ncbi:hypothetical protein NL676_017822 [Syzygium grande]|nr:hypothetical protein NL676_017822 [Syzygium grande]